MPLKSKKLFSQKIFIAGHKGMAGSSILRNLKRKGYENIITKERKDLNLIDQNAVRNFFEEEKPDQVYIAAGKVGGIYANNLFPAEFIFENLMIAANIVDAAFHNKVKKILYLGSSCIYPKFASQPMNENAILTGKLETTNEPYAIAKIASIKLMESYNRQYGKKFGLDYRSVMPTNLYGPGDKYSDKNSHVIPALIKRFHRAKIKNDETVIVWGTGKPKREFLYIDDMSEACVFLMNLPLKKYNKYTQPMLSHINVGSGEDLPIKKLTGLISKVIGYKGRIIFNSDMPDGTPRKLLNTKCINDLGWKASTSLEVGLKLTYDDFLKNQSKI